MEEKLRRAEAAAVSSAERGNARHAHVDAQLEELAERVARLEVLLERHQADEGLHTGKP